MPVIKFLQFSFVVYILSLSRIVITNEYSVKKWVEYYIFCMNLRTRLPLSLFVNYFQKQHPGCSKKEVVFKNFAMFSVKLLFCTLFLIKACYWIPATLLKKTPTQVFFSEYCVIFKNTYFEEHLRMAASALRINGLFSNFNLFSSRWKVDSIWKKD